MSDLSDFPVDFAADERVRRWLAVRAGWPTSRAAEPATDGQRVLADDLALWAYITDRIDQPWMRNLAEQVRQGHPLTERQRASLRAQMAAEEAGAA